jgi:glycosyltransferase involved in cell wall biosynthesis
MGTPEKQRKMPHVTASPSLTVLMTVYNGEEYLREAMDSVLAQSWRDYEFLIVNDASTDGSGAVLQSYTDPRIRVISNLYNQGQTTSLNIGLREARGRYIARIDADDVALPRWLTSQMAFAGRHPDCAVVSSWAMVIDEQGRAVRLLKTPLTREGFLLRSLTASPINHGGCLMRRDIVLEAGGYDEAFKIVADYDLWSRLLRGGEHFAAQKALGMAIRFHGASISKARKYDLVLPETTKVMRDNILFLTGRSLAEAELALLWRTLYDEGNMPLAEFLAGRELVRETCLACREDTGISPWSSLGQARALLKAADGKRAIFHIVNRDTVALKAFFQAVIREYGFFSAFSFLRLVSFLGLRPLTFTLQVFRLLGKVFACIHNLF